MVICKAEDPCFSGTYKSHGVPQFLDGSDGASCNLGAALRATFVSSCFWEALPPVDLQAVCSVCTKLSSDDTIPLEEHLMPTESVSCSEKHLMPTDSDSCSEKLCQAEINKWCVEERV